MLGLPGNDGQGQCCNPIGGPCQNSQECCQGNCVDGSCACRPTLSTGDGCFVDSDCCSGFCVPQTAALAGSCSNPAGGACSTANECISNNCIGGGSSAMDAGETGTCGACSVAGGNCGSLGSCCSGLTCVAKVTNGNPDVYSPGQPFVVVDAGAFCCVANGGECTQDADCCSQQCQGGTCACVTNGSACDADQGCCSGGVCRAPLSQGSSAPLLGCCQAEGQECFASGECCSGYCANQACGACVPAGTSCSSTLQDGGCCSGTCSNGTCA